MCGAGLGSISCNWRQNRWLVVCVDGLAAKAAGGGEAFLLLLCVRRYGWVESADAGHVPLFMPFFFLRVSYCSSLWLRLVVLTSAVFPSISAGVGGGGGGDLGVCFAVKSRF